MSGPVDFDELMGIVTKEDLTPRGPQETTTDPIDRYKYAGSCRTLAEKFDVERSCCSSCHSDHNMGYSQLGELYNDEEGIYYNVCCQMASKIKSQTDSDLV